MAPAAPATATEKKFKWSTSLDSGFKFDFKNAVPVADLSAVEWTGTKGVERSESGAEVRAAIILFLEATWRC